MNLLNKIILTSAMALAMLGTNAAEWQMKQAPAMTKWSEQITPDNVLQEYPRPIMERSQWINLNGVWDLRKGVIDEAYSKDFTYDKAILVPFPIESALSGIMEKSDDQCYWYHRTFTLPKNHNDNKWIINFGAVDWQCIVYVNGKLVGEHKGGYDPFSFDITDALKSGTEQDIAVYIYDNTGSQGQPTGKQSKNPSICWYTAVSGIWQTVWLEPVSKEAYITSFTMEPTLDRSWLSLKVNANDADATAKVVITDRDGNEAGTISGKAGSIMRATIANVHPWSTEDPYLYDVKITLEKNGKVTDEVKSYCGMRKIEVKKDANNIPRIYLNGKQIFQLGPLDQGWWPDGLYTAPCDEALLFDIQEMKKLGCNMIRKHIKVEPDRWYYHCDREGILVWQDLPSGNVVKGYESEAKANFERESINIVEAIKSHPSIVHWIVFNEGWGQFDTDRMTNIIDSHVNTLSPSRYGKASLICCASGWTDSNIGNIIDIHSYPHPGCPHNANRAAVCGEYGGITLKVPGHIWPGGDFGYTGVENGEDFTQYFTALGKEMVDLYRMGLNAAVYTQLSDVEIEKNGFFTYDRRVLKPASPYGDLRKSIEECINLPQDDVFIKPILSTAKDHAYKWHYVTETPSDRHWYSTTFDDSAWKIGEGAMGHGINTTDFPGLVKTDWNTNQIYQRRWFYLGDISQENINRLRFTIFHDDDVNIYINGVWAGAHAGCTFNYWFMDINKEALATLKPNSWNLIAVECKQGTGQQIIDVGLSAFVDNDFDYTEKYDELANPKTEPSPAPGAMVKPKFSTLKQPVPAEPAQGSNNKKAPAGQFIHTADRSNVAWGDIDGDGNLELVYGGYNSHTTGNAAHQAMLYKYAGNDQFTRLTSPFAPAYYACPTFIDFDNNGTLDLYFPGFNDKNYDSIDDIAASFYSNNGDGTFTDLNADGSLGIQPIYNAIDGGRGRHWVATGDYDRDGYTDIVVTGREDYMGTNGYGVPTLMSDRRATVLYRNNEGKGFVRQELPIDGKRAFHGLARGSVNMADMDNDGLLDVISSGFEANEGHLYIYWNNGDGTFSESEQVFYGSYDSSCEIADLDADGLNDIFVSGFSSNKGSDAKSMFIYRNNGNRNFAMLNDSYCGFEGTDGSTPAIADVNHDGLPDILTGGHGTEHEITTWLYINKGDMLFEQFGAYYNDPFGKQWRFERISHGNSHLVDYNNDGFIDAWCAGWAHSSSCQNECSSMLYKNISGDLGIAANTRPTTPTDINASYDKSTGMVTFTWKPSTDDVTPKAALRYNIYLRRTDNGKVFMTVPADIKSGHLSVDAISGEIATTAYMMRIPNENTTYEWGVQAIDNGKMASAWAVGKFNPATSGIKSKKADAVKIYGSNRAICYEVPEYYNGATMNIYNAASSLIASRTVKGKGSVDAPAAGVYIVTVRTTNGIATTTKLSIR